MTSPKNMPTPPPLPPTATLARGGGSSGSYGRPRSHSREYHVGGATAYAAAQPRRVSSPLVTSPVVYGPPPPMELYAEQPVTETVTYYPVASWEG